MVKAAYEKKPKITSIYERLIYLGWLRTIQLNPCLEAL
jgi:hypothetical protein